MGCLALGNEPAKLGHPHRRDPDMTLDRDTGVDDGFDVGGVVAVAFTLHHFGIGLMNETASVFNRLLLGDMEAPVRHINHSQPVF